MSIERVYVNIKQILSSQPIHTLNESSLYDNFPDNMEHETPIVNTNVPVTTKIGCVNTKKI